MSDRLRPLPWHTLAEVFLRDGFSVVREHGDHLVLTKSGVVRPVMIPKYHEVPIFIIRNNLRTAGISRERFFSLLTSP